MSRVPDYVIEACLKTMGVQSTVKYLRGYGYKASERTVFGVMRAMEARNVKRTLPANYKPSPARYGPESAELDGIEGSEKLLEAQLATGQYCGVARARWLAKHAPQDVAA